MTRLFPMLLTTVLYIGTVDSVTDDTAHVELKNPRTSEVTTMDLPIKMLPCTPAFEGMTFTVVRDGEQTSFEGDCGCGL